MDQQTWFHCWCLCSRKRAGVSVNIGNDLAWFFSDIVCWSLHSTVVHTHTVSAKDYGRIFVLIICIGISVCDLAQEQPNISHCMCDADMTYFRPWGEPHVTARLKITTQCEQAWVFKLEVLNITCRVPSGTFAITLWLDCVKLAAHVVLVALKYHTQKGFGCRLHELLLCWCAPQSVWILYTT